MLFLGNIEYKVEPLAGILTTSIAINQQTKKNKKTKISMTTEDKNNKAGNGLAIWVGLGIAFGAAFGASWGNPSLGVAMGIVTGVVVRTVIGIVKKRE